jgi:hypothetical protein
VGRGDALGESIAPVGSVLGASVGAGEELSGAGVGEGPELAGLLLGWSVGRSVGLTGVEQAARARATHASSDPVPIVRARMAVLPSRSSRVDAVERCHPS